MIISEGNTMQKKALVIIDIQNDITKNYKDVIGNINKAIANIEQAKDQKEADELLNNLV